MMRSRPRNLWVVILAGGHGRASVVATSSAQGVCTPKQYCSFNGGPSLLQLTLRRALRLVPRNRIALSVSEPHRRWWEPALWPLRRSGVVVQPSDRGTGLGILLPLLVIARVDPTARFICFPSDHYVENEEVLVESMQQATNAEILNCGKLTLLGISANAMTAGLGYRSPTANDPPVAGICDTGIVAGLVQTLLDMYSKAAPTLLRNLRPVVDEWLDPRVPSAKLISLYAGQPVGDFSRDVLRRQPARLQSATLPPCGWKDVGTPVRLVTTLWALRSQDECGRPPVTEANILHLSLGSASIPAARAMGMQTERLQE